MAEAKAPPAKSGNKEFWTHKLGPFPVYVWAIGVVAVGGYYWYTHYGPGASKQQAQQATAGRRGGLKTFAPRISERIISRGRPGRPPRRPPPTPTGGGPVSPATVSSGPATADIGGPPGGGLGGDGSFGSGPTSGFSPVPAPTGFSPVNPTPTGFSPVSGPTGFSPVNPADRDRRDRDRDRDRRDRDRDRRGRLVPPRESASVSAQQPGQPVDAGTGQPVYWEWTHAHRPPEVAYQVPVPEPQQAYAPMTGGATYDAASAALTG